jgi:hypothetical protein
MAWYVLIGTPELVVVVLGLVDGELALVAVELGLGAPVRARVTR